MRILIMGNNPHDSVGLRTLLLTAGYEVAMAVNGREGMDFVRNHGTDAVITDLFMPEQDGIETIGLLRKDFPTLPIIAVTGGTPYLSLENARETASLIGAHAFMTKPVDSVQLLRKLRDLLPPTHSMPV